MTGLPAGLEREGVLVASPRPAEPHQRVLFLLAMQIHQQLPP